MSRLNIYFFFGFLLLFPFLQDDEVFIDILKTLKFLKTSLRRYSQEFIEDALDFSKGIKVSSNQIFLNFQ